MNARTHAGVAIGMIAASVLMLSPFTNLAHLDSALHSGDGRVQAWVLAWVGQAIGTGRPLFDANMFHPARASLAHTDHMAALGVLGAPIWWLSGNAILEFNLLQLIGPALGAYAMFLLARAWTRDARAALVAGLAYGCSSFTLLHNAHLNLTWNAGLPLAALAFERWWRVPTWPRLAAWWAPAIFTVLVSWYLAVLLTLLLAALTVALAVTRERGEMTTRLVQASAAAVLGFAVVLPFLTPYLGRGSEAGEAVALAADWRSYLVPSEHTLVGRALFHAGVTASQGIWGERTLFLGWTLTLLAAAGLFTAARESDRAPLVLLTVLIALGTALSFGPSTSGFAPFDLAARLPGLGGFRATARFALLVTFAVSLLAAFALARVGRAQPARAPIASAAAAALVLLEVFVVDFPAGRPAPERMPEAYRLAAQDGARAVVALPMYAGEPQWFLEGDYLLYSTTGGFVPLANGIGRWVPAEYLALGEATRGFPSRETAEALRLFRITHVVFHGGRYGRDAETLLQRVRQGREFSIVDTRGSDTLLRVNPG